MNLNYYAIFAPEFFKPSALMKKIFIFFISILLLGSCIPRKKLTYLQSESANVDSLRLNYANSRYEVQVNDILNIAIRSFNPEVSNMFNITSTTQVNQNGGDLMFYLNGYTVDIDGNIDLPVLGKMYVLGMNTESIKKMVLSKLSNYFQNEVLNVTVQLAGVRFTLIGEVSGPGKYTIYQNQVNIFEALAVGGDISLVGDRTSVQIMRQVEGSVKFYEVDLTDRGVVESPYFYILPNDVINVKPLPAKSWGIGTTGFATIASVLTIVSSTLLIITNLQRF
ncbi:MAG TPA: sugar transporter [Cryomorphaceae bacterium]|nr:sugar transporter [Owenweeksia sp.]MBF98741.1 sugar transporter [Owenweeksia sp.]HAD96472.1 sugar transporter [Cryomorphaceae bacterium]HBF19644.1 sugar transporter [Cryomorphaceae bacterium]HCQ16572.1 sugar transporter [Cryomorphaceae bacterium]